MKELKFKELVEFVNDPNYPKGKSSPHTIEDVIKCIVNEIQEINNSL